MQLILKISSANLNNKLYINYDSYFLKLEFVSIIFDVTSGAAVSQNCSYIQNPNFHNAYGVETAISFTVNKCSAGNN